MNKYIETLIRFKLGIVHKGHLLHGLLWTTPSMYEPKCSTQADIRKPCWTCMVVLRGGVLGYWITWQRENLIRSKPILTVCCLTKVSAPMHMTPLVIQDTNFMFLETLISVKLGLDQNSAVGTWLNILILSNTQTNNESNYYL